MLLILTVSCAPNICWASVAFGTDLPTNAAQPGSTAYAVPNVQFLPDTGQQASILGDLAGLRTWLDNRGIDLGLGYLSESAWNVSGGKALGGTYAGQENLSLDFDWEKIASLDGFYTHIDFVSRQGRNVSRKFAGDDLFQAQEIFGSEAVVRAFIHLAYFYSEQQLINGDVDIKVGRVAVRNDFGTLPGACFDFMSLSICANRSQTSNIAWTVFPLANWGGLAEFKISHTLTFKVGTYEVNPNDGGAYGFRWGLEGASGILVPAELDWHVALGPDRLSGIYKIGGSYDTTSLPDWFMATDGLPLPLTSAPAAQTRRETFYVLGKQKISQAAVDPARGITVLAGYEYNTPQVSLFEHFAFLGLIDVGPLSWRPEDQLGFEIAYGRVSSDLTRVQRLQSELGLPLSNDAPGIQTNEVIVEVNYHIKSHAGFYVMPDLQYIVRPSGASTYPNAWVVGFRVSAEL